MGPARLGGRALPEAGNWCPNSASLQRPQAHLADSRMRRISLGPFKASAVGLGGLFLIGVLLVHPDALGRPGRPVLVRRARRGDRRLHGAQHRRQRRRQQRRPGGRLARAADDGRARHRRSRARRGAPFIAGGDVVSTISKGIVDPAQASPDTDTFILAMMASLLGRRAVDQPRHLHRRPGFHHSCGSRRRDGRRADRRGRNGRPGLVARCRRSSLSWVICRRCSAGWSPDCLPRLHQAPRFIRQPDRMAASRRWIPPLIAHARGQFHRLPRCFKGLSHVWRAAARGDPRPSARLAGVATHMVIMRPIVARAVRAFLENRRKAVSSLFTLPLDLFRRAALLRARRQRRGQRGGTARRHRATRRNERRHRHQGHPAAVGAGGRRARHLFRADACSGRS